MNTVESRMMGQMISSRMFSGYAQANNLKLARLLDKRISAMDASRRVEELRGLQPTMGTDAAALRTKVLSFEDSTFLRNYRNNMLDMQIAAGRVKGISDTTRENLTAMAADPAVAEARGRLKNADDVYTLAVEQLAQGQVNTSAPMAAEEPLPSVGGSIRLETGKGKFDFFMSGAGMEDNREMLESFAARLNARDTGVTASVVEVEAGGEGEAAAGLGGIALRLESSPGEKGSFGVSGSLAQRLGIRVTQEAGDQEAVYSIRKNGGEAETFTSEGNTVSVDGITLKLKGTGSTEITASDDIMEGMAENLSGLVDNFNQTLNFLWNNSGSRLGAANQLQRMMKSPLEEKDLSRIGLSAQRNGSITFDREAFLNQARRSPAETRSLAEDFARSLENTARQGLRESSGNLAGQYSARPSQGTVEYASRVEALQKDPVNVLSTYSRNGVYNLMNFYAAGVLMNLNA